MTPKRIQRKRTKGWRMPEGAVSITRPGRYGNPFKVGGYYLLGDGRDGHVMYLQCLSPDTVPNEDLRRFTKLETKEQCVEWFRKLLNLYPKVYRARLEELRGKDVACFCREDECCHGDVWLELSNQ